MSPSVRERPIIFSGEMVRAILDGRKTQTRRVMKPQPERCPVPCPWVDNGWAMEGIPNEFGVKGCSCVEVKCPYHEGERLWVRETFQIVSTHRITEEESWFRDSWPGVPANRPHMTSIKNREHSVVWRADGEMAYGSGEALEWRSPIHMPRWASRITLEITEVRVQRLLEISEDDANAEGVRCDHGFSYCTHGCGTPAQQFRKIWDKINAKRGFSWESDPLVWAITFQRIEPGSERT